MKLTRRHLATALGACAIAVGTWLAMGPGVTRDAAPEVEFALLDGQRLTTSQLKGKVVLVNFWATGCASCVREMPQITATFEKFRARGFDTVAVAMAYDPPAYVASFAESRKLPFAVAIDNTGQVAERFGPVRLTPTSLLIDKRGRIVKRYVGEPDFAALQALVERLLADA